MKLAYEGFTLEGEAVVGTIAAGAEGEARRLLREQGIFATRIGAAERLGAGGRWRGRRMSLVARAAFFRQLALLIATGTPLVDALAGIEKQATDPRIAAVVGELRRRVEEGSAFSEALAAMPDVFDPICRTMAAAGEAAGKLDRMLEDLAEVARRDARTRRAVLGALAYPAATVVAAVAVLIGLIVGVVPKFRVMFEAIQAPVPPATAALMATGEFLASQWIAALVVALSAVGAIALLARASAPRRVALERLLHVPIAGPLLRSLATARMLRSLGLLLEAKVALLDALRLVGESMTHPTFAALLARAQESVAEGESLSGALGRADCVDPAVRQAIASGERSGRLGTVLTQLAKHLDEDNEVAVRGVSRSLEPLLLGGLGLLIGTVAVGLFLPLFDVAASAGGGG